MLQADAVELLALGSRARAFSRWTEQDGTLRPDKDVNKNARDTLTRVPAERRHRRGRLILKAGIVEPRRRGRVRPRHNPRDRGR